MLMKPSRRRLNRRSFLSSTALATAGVIVAACGGQQPAAPAAPKAAESKPTAAPKVAESKPAESKPAESKPAESKPATAPQAAAAKAPAPAGPVTIRFFTGEDDPTQIKVYEEIFAEYRQQQPNVSFSLTPSPTDILQKITASLAAKTAPEFSG